MGDSINRVVKDLRECANRMAELCAEHPAWKVYFPPRLKGARQPARLSGYLRMDTVTEHLRYFADMLEE